MNIPVSYKTLSRYLDGIPKPSELSDILLAHICEVEGIEARGDDTIFDLKITPDRGDLLAYRGIAREISVHSSAKLKEFAPNVAVSEVSTKLAIDVREPKACTRYIGRVVEGVDRRESPAWLVEALEASGQRSINAIVDVTNFVMLELGQPMHAFDAGKLASDSDSEIKIIVRNSIVGEKMETLDGKDVALPFGTLIVADSTRPLAIAGVKGGAHAGVGEDVSTIILEAATFDAALVRKSSAAVGIRTDSSRRFEHSRAPELAIVAMERATELLLEIFPEARAGVVVDVYPRPASAYRVGSSSGDISRILGIKYSSDKFARDLEQLGFTYEIIKNGRERIVARVRGLVGTPYFLGASVLFDAPRKFDCSGFASYIYLQVGVKIPRISADQYVFGEEVHFEKAEAGDLVFSFNDGDTVYHESIEWLKGTKIGGQGIDHVGIYMGDGMVAHASRYNKNVGSEGGVVIEKLSESPRFKTIVGVRRMSQVNEERFSIIAPPERFDIRIPADLAEEVARLISYDKIPETPISSDGFTPAHNDIYDATLRVRNTLATLGFSEIFTYAFRKEGKVELENPMAEGINFLRDNLFGGMRDAIVFNARNAPLLGVDEILMFEIGTVFLSPEEEKAHISIGVTIAKNMKQSKKDAREKELLILAQNALTETLGVKLSWIENGNVCECVLTASQNNNREYSSLVLSSVHTPYKRISAYPFVLRDIAMWATDKITQDDILAIIRTEGGELLVRDRLFDVFEKDSKTSYAFNLVFQSYERTLVDVEINEVMARITEKLSALGLEVR